MPLAIHEAWPRVATRALILVCGLSLLATSILLAPPPVAANGLGDRISANRSGQLYAERAMRYQDAVLAQVKRDLKGAKKDLKRARQDQRRTRQALASATAVVGERKSRLVRIEGEYADPSEAPSPDAYAERLKQVRREVRVAERRKRTISNRSRAQGRVVNAKRARLSALKRAMGAATAGRAAAEGALASRIVEMTRLAAERADNQAAVSLHAQASFSWPTSGRISQTYGCTGFRYNPARGSCRHFHDGIDVVDAYGTPVRAVAVGVVAFAGWNPWDEAGRAWIVVVAHPDGYVSRYGHLTPTDRVRAGELVHTGQIIGKMGNTGRSTGTHLHFELLRGGRDVNPLAYLPAGVIKIDKTSTRKGEQALKAKQKARERAKEKSRARREAQVAAAEATTAAETTATAELVTLASAPVADACSPGAVSEYGEDLYGYAPDAPQALAADCISGSTSASTADEMTAGERTANELSPAPARERTAAAPQPAAAALPGVPLSPRGTSPVPA
ncbi:MAG: M23 family metallopeptidase [Candidatus Limnocylindrales bacterium]